MTRKFITLLLIIGVGIFAYGCGHNTASAPVSKEAEFKPREKVELMEGLEKSLPTGKQTQEDDILELKHYKYGVSSPDLTGENEEAAGDSYSREINSRGTDGNGDYSRTVSIQLLTVEEFNQIVDSLIELGYLAEDKARDEKEFEKALIMFQQDNNLQVHGKVDSATVQKLNEATTKKIVEERSQELD